MGGIDTNSLIEEESYYFDLDENTDIVEIVKLCPNTCLLDIDKINDEE